MKARLETIWIDVGGTRTTAWRREGARLRKFLDAPSDADKLPAVVRTARPSPDAADLVIGLRGAWTAPEKSAVRRRLGLGRRDRVLSDIELAHELLFDGQDGIVLNGGTGSIAFGRAGKKSARAGGLGPLMGDEGSAFWIGREYLTRVVLDDKTFWKVRAVAKSSNPVAAIAAWARACAKDARRGGEAKKIVSEAQDALARLVSDVARQLGSKKPVALRGGLFADKTFRSGVERALARAGFTVRSSK